MTYELRDQAKNDLVAAARYYNGEQPGLGDRLIDAIEERLAQIAVFPKSAPVVYGDVRRIQTRRFRFGIFYLVSPERIEVLRIFHLARDPENWPRPEF